MASKEVLYLVGGFPYLAFRFSDLKQRDKYHVLEAICLAEEAQES